MLVGPSITLEDLEEHMRDRIYEMKMELPKLQKEFSHLREEFKSVRRTSVVEKEGKEVEIMNPEFVEIPDKMKEIETQIKNYQEQQEFMESKIDELETIEERSKGRNNIDKANTKITLTLNDCLMLGISTEKAPIK